MFENLKQTAQTAATVAGLAGASLGMERPAEGVLMLPGQSAQSYLGLGATAQGRVGWLSGISSSTGQQLGGYGTVTFINPYQAITAAHVVSGLFQNGNYARIGMGGNYFSDPGQQVDAYQATFYPTYQQGSVNTNNPDIAILTFATPLAGVSQVSYGTANPIDIVTSFGYGFAFFAGAPIVQPDGFRRGWNAQVGIGDPFFGSNQWYNYTQFGDPSVPVNGKGLAGDSGGGVYNSQGQLVGINFGQTGNGASVGSTSYLDLSQPEVLSWLQANTIPTPGAVGLLGLAALGMRGRRRA
jgi:hypothetical protein